MTKPIDYKTISALLLFLCLPCRMTAQLEELSRVPTPTATQLGKFGDVPVSLYTGRPAISIPIYHNELHGVPLDITLNYESGGVPVNQLPGWTGECWTLNAGGVITRSQNGWPDEYNLPEGSYPGFLNYFLNYSYIASNLHSLGSTENYVHTISTDCAPDVFHFNFMGKSGYFMLGNDGEWKVSSDDNLSVVFNVNEGRNYIYPLSRYYPGVDVCYMSKVIKGFTIVDDDGNQYIFGGDSLSIEFGIDFLHSNNYDPSIYSYSSNPDQGFHDYYQALASLHPIIANSWYLTEVKNRHGATLYKFTYRRGKMIAQLYKSMESMTHGVNMQWPGLLSNPDMSFNQIMSDGSWKYYGTLNFPAYLSEIHTLDSVNVHFISSSAFPDGTTGQRLYPSLYNNGVAVKLIQQLQAEGRLNLFNGYLPFYYLQTDDEPFASLQAPSSNRIDDPLSSTSVELLDRITIQRRAPIKAYGKVRIFKFNYDCTGRTHLKYLYVRSSNKATWDPASQDTTPDYQYQFNYNDYNNLPGDYLTLYADHWGYYSDRFTLHMDTLQTPGGLIDPNMLPPNISFRDPDPNDILYGTLTDIIHPTGGKTHFDYEPNTYSQFMDCHDRVMRSCSDSIGGGLRVASISDYDKDNTLLAKRIFSYTTENGSSSSGQLYQKPRYDWLYNTETICGDHSVTSLSKSAPVIPLVNAFGPSLGYSRVKETFLDGSSNTYTYINFSDSIDGYPTDSVKQVYNTPFANFSSRQFMRGRPKGCVSKDSDGTIYRKVTNTYRQDDYENQYVLSSNLALTNTTGPNACTSEWIGCVHKIFHPKYDISHTKTETRYGDVFVTDNVYNQYGNYALTLSTPQTHTFELRKPTMTRIDRKSKTFKKTFTYPFTDSRFRQACFFPATSVTEYNNGVFMNRKTTEYDYVDGLFVPKYEVGKIGSDGDSDTLVTYLSYTPSGKVDMYREKGRYPTKLFWSEDERLLARACCPYDFSQITCDKITWLTNGNDSISLDPPFSPPRALGDPLQTPFNPEGDDEFETDPRTLLKYQGRSLFDYPLVDATVYTYDKGGLVSSITEGNGLTTYFYYDIHQRLKYIKDTKKRLLKMYDYNY